MPRPKKYRHCGCTIKGSIFKPTGTPLHELKQIGLQRDELEALRLCDLDGLVAVSRLASESESRASLSVPSTRLSICGVTWGSGLWMVRLEPVQAIPSYWSIAAPLGRPAPGSAA